MHPLQYGYFELARLCQFVKFLSINVSKVKKETHILCFDYTFQFCISSLSNCIPYSDSQQVNKRPIPYQRNSIADSPVLAWEKVDHVRSIQFDLIGLAAASNIHNSVPSVQCTSLQSIYSNKPIIMLFYILEVCSP